MTHYYVKRVRGGWQFGKAGEKVAIFVGRVKRDVVDTAESYCAARAGAGTAIRLDVLNSNGTLATTRHFPPDPRHA